MCLKPLNVTSPWVLRVTCPSLLLVICPLSVTFVLTVPETLHSTGKPPWCLSCKILSKLLDMCSCISPVRSKNLEARQKLCLLYVPPHPATCSGIWRKCVMLPMRNRVNLSVKQWACGAKAQVFLSPSFPLCSPFSLAWTHRSGQGKGNTKIKKH